MNGLERNFNATVYPRNVTPASGEIRSVAFTFVLFALSTLASLGTRLFLFKACCLAILLALFFLLRRSEKDLRIEVSQDGLSKFGWTGKRVGFVDFSRPFETKLIGEPYRAGSVLIVRQDGRPFEIEANWPGFESIQAALREHSDQTDLNLEIADAHTPPSPSIAPR